MVFIEFFLFTLSKAAMASWSRHAVAFATADTRMRDTNVTINALPRQPYQSPGWHGPGSATATRNPRQ
jgi:hypothetical protein